MMKKIIIKEELKKGNNHPERLPHEKEITKHPERLPHEKEIAKHPERLPHEKEIERKNIKVKIRKIR